MFENNQLQQTITERLPLAVIMLALVALVLLVLGTSPVAQAAAITANARCPWSVSPSGLGARITAANTATGSPTRKARAARCIFRVVIRSNKQAI